MINIEAFKNKTFIVAAKKNKYPIAAVIGLFLLLLYVVLAKVTDKNQAELIYSFFNTTEFEDLFVGKLKFEDKILGKYSKEYSPESDSYLDKAISWGKDKAFAVEADLHIVISVIFKPEKNTLEIIEKDNSLLVRLRYPTISRLDVDFEKTIVNFKKAGFLSDDPERESFVVHEVFTKNKNAYKVKMEDKWSSEAKEIIKRGVRRRLSEITELNKIVDVEFFK